MDDLLQSRGGRGADLPIGGIGADQMRVGRLQRIVLADQRVISGVGYLRRVLIVVEAIVPRDLLREAHQAVGGVGFGEGGGVGHFNNSSASPSSNNAKKQVIQKPVPQ